jgi:hypothetical protein
MFVCYLKIDDKALPVICEEMNEDPLLPNYIILSGTKLLEDSVLPVIDVDRISVDRSSIIYYVAGDLKENSIEVFELLKRNREKLVNTKKAQDEFDDFIEKTEENKKIEKVVKQPAASRRKSRAKKKTVTKDKTE